ncbi:unnamed protein product [Amoebophrya sp. A120]|nr:unnamed protein product [Amoebophrya sp. A120]|eukprot:GSA120T00006691001.1
MMHSKGAGTGNNVGRMPHTLHRSGPQSSSSRAERPVCGVLDPYVIPPEKLYLFIDSLNPKVVEALFRSVAGRTTQNELNRIRDFDGFSYYVGRINLRQHEVEELTASVNLLPAPVPSSTASALRKNADRDPPSAVQDRDGNSVRKAVIEFRLEFRYLNELVSREQETDQNKVTQIARAVLDKELGLLFSHRSFPSGQEHSLDHLKQNYSLKIYRNELVLLLPLPASSSGTSSSSSASTRAGAISASTRNALQFYHESQFQWLARLPATMLKLPLSAYLLAMRAGRLEELPPVYAFHCSSGSEEEGPVETIKAGGQKDASGAPLYQLIDPASKDKIWICAFPRELDSAKDPRLQIVVPIHYEDPLEVTVGQLACQEFQEAQRSVTGSCVPCSFYPHRLLFAETASPGVVAADDHAASAAGAARRSESSFDLLKEHLRNAQARMRIEKNCSSPQERDILSLFAREQEAIAGAVDDPRHSSNMAVEQQEEVEHEDARLLKRSRKELEELLSETFSIGVFVFTVHAMDGFLRSPKRVSWLAQYITSVRPFLAMHVKQSKSGIYSRMRGRIRKLQESINIEN